MVYEKWKFLYSTLRIQGRMRKELYGAPPIYGSSIIYRDMGIIVGIWIIFSFVM